MDKLNNLLAATPRLVLVVAVLLLAAGTLAAWHFTHPAAPGAVLTRRQQHRLEAHADSARSAARADSARATSARRAALVLRAGARLYEDSATYYETHAKAITLPAADTASLRQFWTDFFAE